jgi:hypothetical protein
MNANRSILRFHSLVEAASLQLVMLLVFAVIALSSQMAVAQGLPTTLKGDVGLQAGSQPPPGFYITNIVFNYNFDTLKTNDGSEIKPIREGSLNQTFYGLAATYVSKKKILGAHYSASFVLPLINFAINTPTLDLRSGWSSSDMYFQPIQLGWHFKQASNLVGNGTPTKQ